jgi:hypothetical protein
LRSIATSGFVQEPDLVLFGAYSSAIRWPVSCSHGSGPRLEPAINSFKSLKRIEELEAGVAHLIRVRPEQLHMLDGEPDAINSDASLVRHLEFHRRGPPL